MEQEGSITFSSVVAALLLLGRCITSIEIVNFISELNCRGMNVSDIDDSVDDLMICVHVDSCYSFSLKDNLSYDTILYDDVTVRQFLESHVDKEILSMIQTDDFYSLKYKENCYKGNVDDLMIGTNKTDIFKKNSPKVGRVRKLGKKKTFYSFLGGV